MQVETDEPEIIERVAALDVGKAEVVCCVRVPGPGGQRMQEVRTISTMTMEPETARMMVSGRTSLSCSARRHGSRGPNSRALNSLLPCVMRRPLRKQ